MYSFDSRIRYSETGENAVLTVGSLINYFQDCSTFQTEDAGAGMDWLALQHLAWVLNYWQIDIFRLPRLYEPVRIGTVPYALKSFLGLRNYCMDATSFGETAGAPERLAVANSVWTLMDMEKMYPARITTEHASHYRLEEKLPMEYLDRKIRPAEGGTVRKAEPVEIHHGHLDTNHHVNNGQYVRIAMDALSQLQEKTGLHALPAAVTRNIPDGGEPAEPSLRIRAEYRKQAHLGDVLVPDIRIRREEDISSGSPRPRKRVITVDLQLNGESCCMVEFICKSENDNN